jgi:RimJ/RimL family protein N-acetyltransferase
VSRAWWIRKADPADAEALVTLGRAVGSEHEGWLITDGTWRSAAEERRYLKALRRYPDAAVYLAETEEQRIVARLSLSRDPHPASSHVADLGLMVAVEYRRLGIGRALLDQSVLWAQGAGVTKLELHVFPHNEPAIALYEAFGFEREGYRKQHYRRAEGFVDAILMAYEVKPRAAS